MMTTEKVGQMVMIGVQGTDVTDDASTCQYHMGGVILARPQHGVGRPDSAHRGPATRKADQKVPLFIGVDEEGGQVVRGKSFLGTPPSGTGDRQER